MKLEFFVPGIAKPAGSKTHQVIRRKDGSPVLRPNGSILSVMRDSSSHPGKRWRKAVTESARLAMIGRQQFTEPVKLALYFIMPRPKNHYGSGRNASVLKPSAPKYPAVKPDATKLTRSVEDAMTTAGVWTDDALVCQQFVSKDYASIGERMGVQVRVESLCCDEMEILGGAK